MNPFMDGFQCNGVTCHPSITIVSGNQSSRTNLIINPNYGSSIQGSDSFYWFREENYIRLVREASQCGIPHSVIYHSQYIMDCFLSHVKVDKSYLSMLSSVCLYVASSTILPKKFVKVLQSLPGYSYASLCKQAKTVHNKDQTWVNDAIMFVISNTESTSLHNCPYSICQELLKSINFPELQSFAECVIDVLCSKDRSMALSAHTIAYYSIVALMKKYYGVNNGREPVMSAPIDTREHYLCLCLINTSFPQLQDICMYMASPSLSSPCNHKKGKGCIIPSPKSHFSETCFS